jgi:hypothetical protein
MVQVDEEHRKLKKSFAEGVIEERIHSCGTPFPKKFCRFMKNPLLFREQSPQHSSSAFGCLRHRVRTLSFIKNAVAEDSTFYQERGG